ncbi:inorganic pyrophosphatase [Enterobacterales bacterium]|nr:inorganic pyrophosphatase [Enterobacterales bacterium]
MISVFGHLNPDSDTVCSALIAADWLNAQGRPARAFRLGEINPETRFILQAAGVEAPPLLEESIEDKDVWLVDFSEFEQGPASLPQSNILGIVDHHRLGTVTTRNPAEVWVQPLGSCATLLWQLITRETDQTITASQATLMLGALLSDTVALTSPTTTPVDIKAADELFAISKLNREAFISGLLAAKTDLAGMSAETLINKDAKNYHIAGLDVLLAQIEVSSFTQTDAILPQLIAAMDSQCGQNALDLFALIITDISTKNSVIYFSQNTLFDNASVPLPGMLSRKKEVLPWLTTTLEKRQGL